MKPKKKPKPMKKEAKKPAAKTAGQKAADKFWDKSAKPKPKPEEQPAAAEPPKEDVTTQVTASAKKGAKGKTKVTPINGPNGPSITPKLETAPKPPESAKDPVNRRITPGAAIRDWRVARSLRAKMPGYFLQGGHYQKTARGNEFVVGEEFHYPDLESAKKALEGKKAS